MDNDHLQAVYAAASLYRDACRIQATTGKNAIACQLACESLFALLGDGEHGDIDLGQRALALVLKHEWSGRGSCEGGDSNPACPECEVDEKFYEDGRGWVEREHKPGCAWGAVCEEARRI